MGLTLKRIDLIHVAVPLRSKIRHASHEREVSDNLIVRAELSNGTVGYGEGVPRSYVTGETIDSTFAALRSFDAARLLGVCDDRSSTIERISNLQLADQPDDPRSMRQNAARSALEIALLDAFGRVHGMPISQFLDVAGFASGWLSASPAPVRYSGAITASSPRGERISAWKMRLYGFAQVKVKVGVQGQNDPERLARFRRVLGRRVNMRIDANEAWSAAELTERVRPLLAARPSVLEQPVPHEQVDELAHLRPALGVPIMLDESLCGWPDAVRSVERGLADFFNVRISKCGGIFPSLRLMDLAWRNGLNVQLGCHPGETGILSAAGRQFACRLPRIAFLEGSYDRHVLGQNVIQHDITFRYGGRAPALAGPGLGVTVDPGLIEPILVRTEPICYE